ncbi:hypothetical protein L6R53_02525 [Myxococcota bacterium]|nr:hypothetical protein [Myxococcota bacterium]
MAIHARMRILDLMEEHPEVDEVFENYGVEVTDEVMAMTLKELCREEGINYWELKSDMVEAVGWDGSADIDDDEEEDEEEERWMDDDADDDVGVSDDDDDDDFDDEDGEDEEDGPGEDDEEGEEMGEEED